MSNTSYDVEKNISYSSTYKHYIPAYQIAVPYYSKYGTYISHRDHSWTSADYKAFISFDDKSEEEIKYYWNSETKPGHSGENLNPPVPYYCDVDKIQARGVFSKVYFRNPNRKYCTFNSSNCYLKVNYTAKAPFEVKFNATGYIASSNATFSCSSVEKNIPVQYKWTAATVYYKKSTDQNYSQVSGTVSGSWSNTTVSTNLSLATGYTYNIYIKATADDGTTANTAVKNFKTTDGTAVATCVSPVGTYTNGTVNFIWSHATSYGTKQYAYDLQYSADNGGSWTTVANHVVSSVNNRTVTISSAGAYIWRVRTYNTLDAAGSWASASFINNVPATPPENLEVTTTGRPTVSWVSTTQAAYQVQVLLNDEIVYDSGAVFTGQNTHFVNKYFDDTRAYTVRARIINSLGNESDWSSTGYQQEEINDVEFAITQHSEGGANIEIVPDETFTKFYIQRNGVVIGEAVDHVYHDKYAIGLNNYSVVAVTVDDYSDIQTKGFVATYPQASIVTLGGAQYAVNKRMNEAFQVQTNNDASFAKTQFIGDSTPTHYFNKMKLKSFDVTFFDDNNVADELLGTVVFYADNFNNGGYCFVTAYNKTDSFIKNGQGIYGNEVALTLEVTNYDDSIEYPI